MFCCDTSLNDCSSVPELQNFDQDLSAWNTASVMDMSNMFRDSFNFTGSGLQNWDVSKVTEYVFFA